MNNLVTNLKNLEIETLKNLENSKAKNTLRAYRADFADFSNFCTKNSFNSLPTQPKILSLYITNLSKSHKFSTLKRRIASISVVHKLKGHYLDIKHPIIMENLHGIKRILGSKQISKKPLLINNLKLIIKVLNEEINKKKSDINSKIKHHEILRDKALILIGFAGGFRRSELVNICHEDLEFVTEGLKIFIKKSKTDQSGEGLIKAIPYFENNEFCPVLALKEYIKNKSHYNDKDKIFEISDKLVALLIKKYAKKAGLDSSKFSGHSLRSGFATSAAEAGAEERSIMAMTGHKTTQMVRRYIQEANLFKNNALNKIKL